jgi:hypothetical protein
MTAGWLMKLMIDLVKLLSTSPSPKLLLPSYSTKIFRAIDFAKTLTDVAFRLPHEREGLLGFISTLEAIEKVVPKRAGITARARAIAAAAV